MARDTDSDEEHYRKNKKSKKHKKRVSRSRSRSRDSSYSRDDRRYKKSKSSRHRSKSHSPSRPRSSSHRSYKSRSHQRSSSRSPVHSRSRSRSKSKTTSRKSGDKGVDDTKTMLRHMSKSERLEYKIQKALNAAEKADAALKIKEELKSSGEAPPPPSLSLSIEEQVIRQEAITAIERDGFTASTFKSNRGSSSTVPPPANLMSSSSSASISTSTGSFTGSEVTFYPAHHHTAAMFGTAKTSEILLDKQPKIDLAQGIVSSTLTATARLKLMTGKQLAGPNLLIPVEEKEKRWMMKINAMRRRREGVQE